MYAACKEVETISTSEALKDNELLKTTGGPTVAVVDFQ